MFRPRSDDVYQKRWVPSDPLVVILYLLMQLDPFQIGLDLSIVLYLALRECVLYHLLFKADRQGHRLSGSCPEVSMPCLLKYVTYNRIKGGDVRMDAVNVGDLIEVSAEDLKEKAEGKATAAGRRGDERRQSVQRERGTEKIVHLTMKMDDEDLQVGVGG
ncbi:hypothetical protein Scep_022330 [Stephania cephalantha]|uniref:Uncharacterized protein n=1 Tax=Stephania cephalantha TaxID=152367 RepID=A0AAP0F571_9MAGN